MRGRDEGSEGLFSYVRLEERVPRDHPLRAIRSLADAALARLSSRFDALYAGGGRPSIAPEMLLRATLLQAFFSVRSERQLMEQIDYNLLYRWFVGLPMDAAVWHPTVFSHNRDRLMDAEVAHAFLGALMSLPRVRRLLSSEHFSVDGTLIDAWASMKSFRRKDGSDEPPAPGRNGERDFHGGAGEPAVLHGACADGEPLRAGGGRGADPRHRDGGARGGAGDARPARAQGPGHARRRQGL
jgi:transposase